MFKKRKLKNPKSPSQNGVIEFILVDEDKQNTFLEVKRASDLLPDWYKNVPAIIQLKESDPQKDFTIKRCIPVLDALTSGYFLVTKRDVSFKYDQEKNESKFIGNGISKKEITMHPISQIGDMQLSKEFIKYTFKWGNPYTIKTPEGYSCIFTHPLNGTESPFYSLAGVVDTDSYFQPVLFPFLMKNNFEGTIKAGTPIIQIMPFKRDDWKHVVYEDVPEKYIESKRMISNEYESNRYDADKNPTGGMYKRDYRKKKRYF
jgi:hypothetical protein